MKEELNMNMKETEQLKELIKRGTSLELLSFELDIPMKELKSLEKEVNKKELSIDTSNKIEILRKNYNSLYFKNDPQKSMSIPKLNPEETYLIDSTIDLLEEKLTNINELPRKERRQRASTILQELKKILILPLTVEQAEKIYASLSNEGLSCISSSPGDRIEINIKFYTTKFLIKFANALDVEVYNTNDLEELNQLRQKITLQMEKENLLIGTTRMKIDNKISQIKHQQILATSQNKLSPNIASIVKELANGKLDIDNAKAIIETEAKKSVSDKPQTKFTLTEQQEKKQILFRIRKALREQADQYPIKNPEVAITQIYKLCEGEPEQAIKTVISNLINRKKFEEAKTICNNIIKKEKKSKNTIYQAAKSSQKLILNAEISYFLIQDLNRKTSASVQQSHFELIEKELEKGNIRLEDISLGKNKAGTENITLADIWGYEKTK